MKGPTEIPSLIIRFSDERKFEDFKKFAQDNKIKLIGCFKPTNPSDNLIKVIIDRKQNRKIHDFIVK